MADFTPEMLDKHLKIFRRLGIRPNIRNLNDPKQPSIERLDFAFRRPTPEKIEIRVQDDAKAAETVDRFMLSHNLGRLGRNRILPFPASPLRFHDDDEWRSIIEPASVLWMKPTAGMEYEWLVNWSYAEGRRFGKAIYWDPDALSFGEWGVHKELPNGSEIKKRPKDSQWSQTLVTSFFPGHLVSEERTRKCRDRLIALHPSGKPIVVHGGAPGWCEEVKVRLTEDNFEIQAVLLESATRPLAPRSPDIDEEDEKALEEAPTADTEA